MLGDLIKDLYGVRARAGDIGLELEVEGRNLPKAVPDFWSVHDDHSLRGESCEYVFTNPLKFADVEKALNTLDETFKKSESLFNLSTRTSVHVHLNVQKLTLQEVYTLLGLYFIMENAMVDYSGPDRVGNLFCLRSVDAEYIPIMIARGLVEKSYLTNITNDNIRYHSVNLMAIPKFGSLEFRSFRGCVDKIEILKWISIIQCLLETSQKFNDPKEVIKELYTLGPQNFLERYFPKFFCDEIAIQKSWKYNLERGSHYTFDMAYSTEWISDIKSYKLNATKRRKLKPGECEDPSTDPRFIGAPDWFAEEFLTFERNSGFFINPERRGNDYNLYVNEVYRLHEVAEAEVARARNRARLVVDELIPPQAPVQFTQVNYANNPFAFQPSQQPPRVLDFALAVDDEQPEILEDDWHREFDDEELL